MNKQIRKIVLCAFFAAMTCVATMAIRIPLPLTGYANLGDAIVLLSAFMLGPFFGALASGLGAVFADIYSGYAIYAPATFIIKALVAYVTAHLFRFFSKKTKNTLSPLFLSGFFGEVLMVAGYFAYEFFILSLGFAAAATVPGNIFQAIAGISSSSFLYFFLIRSKYINRLLKKIDDLKDGK